MSCRVVFYFSYLFPRVIFVFYCYLYLLIIFLLCYFYFCIFFLLFMFLSIGLKAYFLWLKISAQLDQVEAGNGGLGHRPAAQVAGPAVASQLSGALQAQACWLASLLALIPAVPHHRPLPFRPCPV